MSVILHLVASASVALLLVSVCQATTGKRAQPMALNVSPLFKRDHQLQQVSPLFKKRQADEDELEKRGGNLRNALTRFGKRGLRFPTKRDGARMPTGSGDRWSPMEQQVKRQLYLNPAYY